MSRISTRAANSILLNQSLRTQQRLFDAQVAIASEKKTQVYQGIAIDSRRLVNIENTRDLLGRFNANHEQMETKLLTKNTTVEAIRETFVNFRDGLGTFETTSKNDPVDVKDIQDHAFRALKAIEGYLNIDIDGQYLFAGNKVLTEPIDFGLTTLDAFQAKFNGDTLNVPTTRDAALEDFTFTRDILNRELVNFDAANFLSFRQDSADELSKLIYSMTTAAATGNVSNISSEAIGAATTNNTTTIASRAVIAGAGAGVTTGSLLTDALSFAATLGDALTFEVLSGGVSQSSSILTVSATSTIADVVSSITNLDSHITASFNTASGQIEIVGSGGLEFEITNTGAAALIADVTAAAAGVSETETITISGVYTAGDTITVDVNGTGAVVYTVSAGDVAGTITADQTTIATSLAAAINAGAGSGIVDAVGSGNVVTLTADAANSAYSTSLGFSIAAPAPTPQTEFQFSSGFGTMVSGTAQTFDTTQSATDLVSKAFGATATDTLTFTSTSGDGTTNAIAFTVGTQTVEELITHINNTDSHVTASFNATTKQVDIASTSGGSVLTFGETGGSLTDFAFNDGTAAVTAGAVTYATGQAASDTLVAAYGATSTDVLTFTLGNGATTNFTIGNRTISELTTAISGLDSTITASFNTTTKQIDMTSATAGTSLKFTNTVGDPLTEFQFNDGGPVASGETTTFTVDGLTKSSTITATSALFANLSAGSNITISNSAANNGTYQVSNVSSDGRTLTINSKMLTDENRSTPTITYPDPTNLNSTISLSATNFFELSFTRSNNTIHSAQAGGLTGIPVGTSFTVTGSANNNGTYTVVSNDGTDLVVQSLKLTDEGLTSGTTSLDLRTNTDVNFNAATKTIEIRQPTTAIAVPHSFNGLTIGQSVNLAGSVLNSGTFTVASIAADGSSITVNETLSDETDTDGIDITSTGNSNFAYTSDTQLAFDATNNTIRLTDNAANSIANAFNGLAVGAKFVTSDMPTANNNRTFTVASISSDGSTITVAEDVETTETDTDGARIRSFAAAATIATNSYYSGDQQTSRHRVSSTQSFENNIDGVDPAFEKGIRALKLIAQGSYGTAGGLDRNKERIDQALYLINSSLQRAVSGTEPFGTEVAGNIEQVEIDIGYHRVLMQTTTEINLDLMAFYDESAADIENADLQTMVTQLLDDQNALEASYQAYARITQLSLTNFL